MEGVKCILLDIEGTICPISFVKDTLFPYALKALPGVLATQWNNDNFKPYRDAFPEGHMESREALQAHVEDLTRRDVKIAYLKNLQGYLWENGYKTGAYSTPLFEDVSERLKQWKEDDYQLAIYSSGSVFAQKLLFGHVQKSEPSMAGKKRSQPAGEDEENSNKPPTKKRAIANDDPSPKNVDSFNDGQHSDEDGTITPDLQGDEQAAIAKSNTKRGNTEATEDLQYLITAWFDTTNAGLKTEPSSYERIAQVMEWSPKEVLFLSDNIHEVDAAVEAGMQSLVVDRPGNAAISEEDGKRLSVVTSLDGVDLKSNPGGDEVPLESSSERTRSDPEDN